MLAFDSLTLLYSAWRRSELSGHLMVDCLVEALGTEANEAMASYPPSSFQVLDCEASYLATDHRSAVGLVDHFCVPVCKPENGNLCTVLLPFGP